MKTRQNITCRFRPGSVLSGLAVLLAAVGLAGCTKEIVYTPDTPAGDEVTISVKVPGTQVPTTRSIAGADGEAVVKTIDILVFDKGVSSSPETLARHVKGRDITQSGNGIENYRVQFKASLGTDANASTLVIIANAADRVEAAVNTGGYGSPKQDILSALTYETENGGATDDGWKWNAAGSGDYDPIPMYGEKTLAQGLKVGMSLTDIDLVRMLARIDVVNNAAGFTLTEVYVMHYNAAGYIAPAWNPADGAVLPSLPASPMVPAQPAGKTDRLLYAYPASPAGGLIGGIYTYEAAATSGVEGDATHTDATCLVVKGTYQGKEYYYRLDFTAATDAEGRQPGQTGFNPATVEYIPLYRNHRYTFTIDAVRGIGYEDIDDAVASLGIMNNLRTSLLVVDERSVNNYVFNGEHYLGIAEDMVTCAHTEGTSDVLCTTNYAYGWEFDPDQAYTGGIEYLTGAGSWLTATEYTPDNGQHNYIRLTSQANTTNTVRTAKVHVAAGRLRHSLTVVQLPEVSGGGTVPSGMKTYVGAFWKANQTGERVIRIEAGSKAGKWLAAVYWMSDDWADGDIALAAGGSPDPAIRTATPGNAESYQVPGSATAVLGEMVSGGTVEFRIGLNSKWSPQPDKPARYAVLLLSYGDYTVNQKIFLRQGHDADYLMEPDDGGINARPLANRFSPYNLTYPGFKGTASTVQSVEAPIRPSDADDYFTAYPSQAGALYQFSPDYGVYAFNPAVPSNQTLSANWSASYSGAYWSTLAAATETCPVGYRRMQNGSTSEAVTSSPTDSELRQSLWNNPQAGSSSDNSLWGYYADGFFDRRAIGEQKQNLPFISSPKSAVSTDNSDVAYIGRLFYNPLSASGHYNASLFFPAAGSRSDSNGYLYYTGNDGCYWSGSASSPQTGWFMNVLANAATQDINVRSDGFSVRCVRE
ncbi:MAG: hypothetical protein LIO68_05630 [Rikenellaceae bacterium]|nr:hypothetical protein [Rikenellaceae bacterium]